MNKKYNGKFFNEKQRLRFEIIFTELSYFDTKKKTSGISYLTFPCKFKLTPCF